MADREGRSPSLTFQVELAPDLLDDRSEGCTPLRVVGDKDRVPFGCGSTNAHLNRTHTGSLATQRSVAGLAWYTAIAQCGVAAVAADHTAFGLAAAVRLLESRTHEETWRGAIIRPREMAKTASSLLIQRPATISARIHFFSSNSVPALLMRPCSFSARTASPQGRSNSIRTLRSMTSMRPATF